MGDFETDFERMNNDEITIKVVYAVTPGSSGFHHMDPGRSSPAYGEEIEVLRVVEIDMNGEEVGIDLTPQELSSIESLAEADREKDYEYEKSLHSEGSE